MANEKAEANGKNGKDSGPITATYSPKGSLITMPRRQDLVGDDAMTEVARRIHGFSGREISKLMTSLQTHILFSNRSLATRRKAKMPTFLEKKLLFEVVDAKVVEHNRTNDFQVTGYDYVNLEERERSAHNSRTNTPKGGMIGSPKITLGSPKITPQHSPHGPLNGTMEEIASLNINTAA